MRATVLALGDLGRSPRIQLHAQALSDAGLDVDLVGFSGSACFLLGEDSRVGLHFVDDDLFGRSRLLRGIFLSLALHKVLRGLKAPDVVLVQTPPAVPSLWLASRFARHRRARLVVDWHNLGFSQLALRTGMRSVSAAAYKTMERRSARSAHAHLCVSPGLRSALKNQFGIEADVFEDHPATAFRPAPDHERPRLREDLLNRGGLKATPGSLVVISPTSWTRDEDFSLVEAAADLLDNVPGDPIILMISGRGELRSEFETRFERRTPGRVRFATVWLPGPDYPRLLPGADLGLSLHASSSGVDFPMKIHDLRGSGLKVLAREFAGLMPRFKVSEDGLTFSTAEELASHLTAAQRETSTSRALHRHAAPGLSWEEAWRRDARSVILGE